MNTAAHNMDPAEIAKFSDLAHHWWEPEGEFRPLHDINPIRLQWINAHAPLKGKTVLDVGCGGGILSDALAREGAQVLGIDLSEKALQIAQLHAMEAQTLNVQYRCIAVEDLAAEQPGKYDIITCMEMLEHVPDVPSVLKAITTLLCPGGWLFTATISKNPKAFALAVVGAEYIAGLLPRGTHEYARFIRPSELAHMARKAGLELTDQSGVAYNPLTHCVKLRADASVNYMQAYQRI